MTNELTLDFASPQFAEDQYGTIEALRKQSFYARSERGVIFFNQKEAHNNIIFQERGRKMMRAIQIRLDEILDFIQGMCLGICILGNFIRREYKSMHVH